MNMTEVVYKEARKDSKRWIACEVMKANADKPMSEVLKLIVERQAEGFTLGDARSYYRYCVAEGFAPGVIEERSRSERKAAPQKKPTLAPLKLSSSPADVEKARSSASEKVAALREKLARVSKKEPDAAPAEDQPSV
jgi:hypothetical protein